MSKHDQTKPLVSFRMPQELVDRMKSYCEKHRTDPSKFLRTLVENALLSPAERVQPLKDIEDEFKKSLRELQTKMQTVSGTLHVHQVGETPSPLWVEEKTPKGSKRK